MSSLAAKEVELLELVEMRLAQAPDEKLSASLANYLPLTILKLNSSNPISRNKVIEICTHINRRLKTSPDILLPVKELISLLPNASALVANFALIYIETGMKRTSNEIAQTLIDQLIWGIAKRPLGQQITIFNILLPIIAIYKQEKPLNLATPKPDPINLLEHEDDARFLLKKFIDLMLYNCPALGRPKTALSLGMPEVHVEQPLPNCLSINDVEFLTNSKKSTWTTNSIELKEIKFLITTGLFPITIFPNLKFVIFLIATSDPAHEVIGLGEDGIRRHNKADFEEKELIDVLYSIYQGSTSPETPDKLRKSAAGVILKSKIIPYFLKSALATNQFPSMLQVCFDSLYGDSSNQKLKSLGIAFVQWIARMAETKILEPVAPVLLSGLLKFISEDSSGRGDDESTRGFAFEAVGLLSKRVKSVFNSDMTILRLFFDSLISESRNVKVSVQEALSMMAEAYIDSPLKEELEEILISVVERTDSSSRFVSTKFATKIFPFSNAKSRVICLLASSDQKLEVKEESKLGLKFPEFIPQNDKETLLASITEYKQTLLPSLNSMVNLLHSRLKKPPSLLAVPGIKYVGGLTTETYTRSVEFLRRLIIICADPVEGYKAVLAAEEFGGGVDDGGVVLNGSVRKSMKLFLRGLWDDENEDDGMDIEYGDFINSEGESGTYGVKGYLDFVEKALLAPESDAGLQAMAAASLRELVALSPSRLCKHYYTKVSWIKPFIFSLKSETRFSMAYVLAAVTTNDLANDSRKMEFNGLINELHEQINDQSKTKTIETLHGSIVALGFLVGRLTYRYPKTWSDFVDVKKVSAIIQSIAENLSHSSQLIILGALASLAEAGRYVPLPFVGSKVAEVNGKIKDFDSLFDKLTHIVKNGKENKVQEAAISTLGQLGLGLTGLTNNSIQKILDFFFSLSSLFGKHVEIHFTIGEALATCSGWKSTVSEAYLDISDADVLFLEYKGESSTVLEACLDKIIKELSVLTVSPVAKKSFCVWLLSLTKFCGIESPIQVNLTKIHHVFTNLLGDRDELTQDVASKGIGLVYDLGNETVRQAVTSSLVSTLTEGKKIAAQSLTGDTPLFGENTLGSSPDGTNLTTYQSILSLASDMNQPDMVYRFLNLASHHAVWNSRRGASLGFGSIMGSSLSHQTEQQLKPYMKTLVPRLYRYQFDPNPKVSEAMRSIWKALIREPKKMIDLYYDEIIKDVLAALGDRMWRNREAACLCLGDLLSGREIAQIEPYMEDIWLMSFRALDDIKESVRVAALATCKSLTSTTVRYCDPSYVTVKQGQKIIDIILPFFLSTGLSSMSEDVRKYSLMLILKIVKKGGVLLKPHISELVYILLEGLSSLEPQVMNYLSFHTASYDISQDQLDQTRLSATKMSPIMEAIESTVNKLDDNEVLNSLIPKLINLVRKGVGLPTKAGCARYLIAICVFFQPNGGGLFKGFADDVLKALSSAVADRSGPVRKSFATAAGYIVNVASDITVEKFIAHLRKIYVENNDQDEIRSISGTVILELLKHAPDKMRRYMNIILPLSFFGARDKGKDGISKSWELCWEELLSTGSSQGLTKLYLGEIVELASTVLKQTPSWPIKKQVGVTFTDLSKIVGDSFYVHMKVVVPLLLEALSGRTWEGKEAVLEALCNVCIGCKKFFDDETNIDLLDQVSIREMKKNNKIYKRFALEAVSKLFQELEVDKFEQVKDYLIDLCTEGDSMEIDTSNVDESREKPLNLLIQANAFKALARFFPADHEQTQVLFSRSVCLTFTNNIEKNVWNVRLAVLEGLDLFLTSLSFSSAEDITDLEMLKGIRDGLFDALDDQKYIAIREKAALVLTILVGKMGGSKYAGDVDGFLLKDRLRDLISKEKLPSIGESLKKLL